MSDHAAYACLEAESFRKVLEEISKRGCEDLSNVMNMGRGHRCHSLHGDKGDKWCRSCLAARAVGLEHAKIFNPLLPKGTDTDD